MSGLFAYARVTSALKPTAAAELRKVAASASHVVLPDNMVIETVAGSVAVFARPGWRKLLDRMYEGDTLVVPTLGDLGGDAKEVCTTVKQLARLGLRVHCLGLGSGRVDLAGPAGRPAMEMLTAVIALKQDRQIEHEHLSMKTGDTPPPLVRHKGRPRSLDAAQVAEARRLLASDMNVAQVARRLNTSRQTIMRMCARYDSPVLGQTSSAKHAA